ncbi:hypothetical protein LLS47_24095 [Rouxiella badensis]|uniref:hypothetical protein n=1 Tax=Rouxiella badensis TaxID=1646377 RepID=UPI001D132CD0|nr:hypothetical protein [Rouxiella badensis]MCC3735979.1 hypothetical protein [Rouxiella badensis]MCC3761376.1 hypothetical protein [Rouxiella badensis]
MSIITQEQVNILKTKSLLKEWKHPTKEEIRFYADVNKLLEMENEGLIETGCSNRERFELSGNKWYFTKSKSDDFKLKTTMSYKETKYKYIYPKLGRLLLEAAELID